MASAFNFRYRVYAFTLGRTAEEECRLESEAKRLGITRPEGHSGYHFWITAQWREFRERAFEDPEALLRSLGIEPSTHKGGNPRYWFLGHDHEMFDKWLTQKFDYKEISDGV